MALSDLRFITCEQLRAEIEKLGDDLYYNKRVLIIDVRNPALFELSHFNLDTRHRIDTYRKKMRVMNIDPDGMRPCTAKNIMSTLNKEDLKVFEKQRRDATDVVIIDSNTDNKESISNTKSKIMRIINALTLFDYSPEEEKIPKEVIMILDGGYKEWIYKYPHWTTNSQFDPDTQVTDLKSSPAKVDIQQNLIVSPKPNISVNYTGDAIVPVQPQSTATIPLNPSRPLPPPYQVGPITPTAPPKPQPVILKPVPTPPRPLPNTPKPNIVKNAPGTAVPVTPVLSLRSSLPRSHSSPNVAQADGDELEDPSDQLDRLTLGSKFESTFYGMNINNNHIAPSAQPASKPRFDRNLKPAAFNNELINAIRAQLNFGRSPEASGKAITGLQNLGNTCFMNSVIQCMAYTPSLVSYLCSDTYYNDINFNSQYGSKGELAIEFGALVEKLNAHRHRYIEPKSFRESVVRHVGFAGNEQQDSHEFMMMLFDKLHHDLNVRAKEKLKQNGIIQQNGNNNDNDSNINIPRATLGYQFWKRHLDMNKSIISDLFEGIFMSTLTCAFCKGQSNTFEVFNCLSLPIPSETRCHLRDCLNHFSNPERIEAAWECPRCKQKREADKKIVICKLPKILIVHLKRFSLDARSLRQKLQTAVDFPLNDLTVDSTNVLPQSAYGPPPLRSSYNLCAVVNHYGHLDGGHYTAFCKLDKHGWYTFDDSNVSEMRDTDVCGQAAYILFYCATC